MRRLLILLILVVMTLTFTMLQRAEASSITTTVEGTQTVYFAGRTQFELMSFPLSGGWVQSDVLDPDTVPDAIDITGLGSLISISASGLWSHTPDPSGPAATGPEGRGIFELSQAEYEPFGVSLLGADLNMLAGVFLSDTAPLN